MSSSEKLRQILTEHEHSRYTQEKMSSFTFSRPMSPSTYHGSATTLQQTPDHKMPRAHLSDNKLGKHCLEPHYGKSFIW